MANEKFCLRWNDFESNISVAFQEIRDDKDFFDVTLACDDEQIQAHKLILSACSPFFRGILRRNPHQHPLLYLKGVKFIDLQSVLNFMYHGEVNVAQEELNSFLTVAEDLQVKGLTQINNDTQNEKMKFSQPKSSSYQKPAPSRSHHSSLPTISHSTPSPLPGNHSVTESRQEVTPVKSEPKDYSPLSAVHPPQQDIYPPASQPLACVEDDGYGYEDEQYAECEQYDDGQGYANAQGNDHNFAEEGGNTALHDRTSLLKYITQNSAGAGASFQCTLCGKTNGQKNNVMKHVESIHFPGSFTHFCKLCDKTVKTKSALEWHNNQYHSKKQHKYPKV